MTLIDTAMAAVVLQCTQRRVQQMVKDGTLTNHGDARAVRLDLAEVSKHAATRN